MSSLPSPTPPTAKKNPFQFGNQKQAPVIIAPPKETDLASESESDSEEPPSPPLYELMQPLTFQLKGGVYTATPEFDVIFNNETLEIYDSASFPPPPNEKSHQKKQEENSNDDTNKSPSSPKK